MDALFALVSLDVAAALFLAALFSYAHRIENSTYLKRWAAAWALLAFTQATTANNVLGRPVPLVHHITPILGVAAILTLVAGTHAFLDKRYNHGWTCAAVAAGIASLLLDRAGVGAALATGPLVAVLAVALLTTSAAMIRCGPKRVRMVPAGGMILWAANALAYPVLGDFPATAVYGTALSSLLQVATGAGLLLVHVERANTLLQESRAHERALIDHAVVGVFGADRTGRFTRANQALLAMLGVADFETLRDTMPLRSLFAVTDDFDRLQLDEDETPVEDRTFIGEAIWVRADGERRWVRFHGRQLASPADVDQTCVEAFATDLTESRRREEHVRSSERLQAVSQLTGGLAHDFNNLLTVAKGNLVLTLEHSDDPGLTDALEAVEGAAELTHQLLDFARAHASDEEVTDATSQLGILARLLRRSLPDHVSLHTDLGADERYAAITALALDQIVLNLVMRAGDALESTPGRIDIRTRTNDEGWLVLTVTDDGPAIDADRVHRIFEPFFNVDQRQPRSGWGLPIVRALAHEAGGRVDVSSKPHVGTTISVFLRAADRTRDSQVTPRAGLAGQNRRILVVDDHPAVLRVTTRVMKHHGYEVVEAESVASGIAALDADLDAIVTDLVLGDGHGTEIIEEIARRGWSIPAVIVSGYPDGYLATIQREDAPPILMKPFDIDTLLALVGSQIARRESENVSATS